MWARKFDTRWGDVPSGDAVGTKKGMNILFEKLPKDLRDGTTLSETERAITIGLTSLSGAVVDYPTKVDQLV